jgi:hypothetical protein
VGIAANFASANDGDITFQAGHFRVEKAHGSVTVFEGAVRVTEIPGFTYLSYNDCLDRLLSNFERTRRTEESKNFLEAFMTGYELNEMLNVGICLRSAAMGGFYIGDKQNDNEPVQQDVLKNLALAVSKSVVRRVKRFSGRDIDLNLTDDLMYYRYYRDRSVPYFRPQSIQDQNDAVNDLAASDDEDYVAMGRITGKMKRTFVYFVGLSRVLQSVQGTFDDRAMRANNYFPSSLQCLHSVYLEDKSRLQQIMEDLNMSDILEIPDLEAAIANGEQFFDQRVTAKIRQFIKTAS